MRGACREVSLHGARVECAEPIEVRSNVYLNTVSHGLIGNATVRYCRRQGMKYVIGLQFTSTVSLAEEGKRQAIGEGQ